MPAGERWGVDLVDYEESWAATGVRMLSATRWMSTCRRTYFGAIWVSNFLEHLPDQDSVAAFLERMRERLAPGGRIAIMGPNFRYCAKEYFDCADHNVILTHVGVEEHLYAAGYDIEAVEPQFLPYSFRGRLPAERRADPALPRDAARLAAARQAVPRRRPPAGVSRAPP